MGDNELTSRFPEMKPISSPPGLGSVNTIGTGMYGKRDYDEETGTYVSTRCFCILFIPLIAIDGLDLVELDYIDVGELLQPANVVPVVVKSLAFGGPNGHDRLS